jgi:hypothetical protein
MRVLLSTYGRWDVEPLVGLAVGTIRTDGATVAATLLLDRG